MSVSVPKVTVAMPAFNHERYVEQALESVLDSGLPNVELIVADDCSSDSTPQLVKRWAERNAHKLDKFQFIERKRNVGLCASLNEIIAAARGDLIHIIASDDYYLPGGLKAKTLAMAAHPEWIAGFCDARAVGPEDQLYAPSLLGTSQLMRPEKMQPATLALELIYNWDCNIPSLQTWRREAYKIHGGEFEYDETVFCEDYDAAWWVMAKGAFGFIPEVCQAYRCRSWPQSSNRNYSKELRDMAYVLAKRASLHEPRVARAMLNFALVQFFSAAKQQSLSDLYAAIHVKNAQKYRALPSEGAPVEGDSGSDELLEADNVANLILELNNSRSELESLRSKWRTARERREAAEAARRKSADEVKALRNKLRYHAANPLRALRLWFQRGGD
jgi:glycosyltransferase involved in cell wall biosynthesis